MLKITVVGKTTSSSSTLENPTNWVSQLIAKQIIKVSNPPRSVVLGGFLFYYEIFWKWKILL